MSDNTLIATAAQVLEDAVAPLTPAIAGMTASIAATATSDLRRQALLDICRSGVITLIQRAGTDAMLGAAIALDDVLGAPPIEPSDEWSRLEELRSALALAAAQRGRSAAPQALRSRNGKGQLVVAALAASPVPLARKAIAASIVDLGDDSSLSHVLRDLEAAHLIDRFTVEGNGREVMVELTAMGRALAEAEGLGATVIDDDVDARLAQLIAVEFGDKQLTERYEQASGLSALSVMGV
jgi:hypothetical protein